MTREEAIYRLKNTAWLGTDKDREETEQAVDMAIESLQSDAVQGEWTHDGSMWENRWVCNKCGHKIFERQTNFCPNCGAVMTPYKGGEE